MYCNSHESCYTPHHGSTLQQPLLNVLPVDARTVSWLQERLCKTVPSMDTDWIHHAKQPCGLGMHTPNHKHPAPDTATHFEQSTSMRWASCCISTALC